MAKVVKDSSHRDAFGYMLEIGDLVMYTPPRYKNIILGRVTDFTSRMIKCSPVGFNSVGVPRFSNTVVLLNNNAVLKDFPDEWIIELRRNPDSMSKA